MALRTLGGAPARPVARPRAERESRPETREELVLTRRPLMLTLLVAPLLLALAGFANLGRGVPAWPAALREVPQRGALLAADGTVLAEGAAENRVYPQGPLAAHLVGFAGRLQPDGRYGLEGLEYTLEERLQAGENVRLTIDPALQASAQTQLRAAALEHGAESGSVVLLEVGTNRVLAAASYPEYDPNEQGRFARSAIANRAFLTQYEPGSVMKPFVIASLLESDRLEADELVPSPPTLRVGWKTFADVASHDPELPVEDVLRYSSNTGMLHLTERFEPQELHAWLEHFGFGQPVGVGGTYTRAGQLIPWRDWVPQDQASVTIGQGISTTALQLAAAYSIFANDGVLVAPQLVEGEEGPEARRVLSAATARTVRSMLLHTVEASSLRSSSIPGVKVAGKTGTADIFDPETGTYPQGWYNLTFAGMFPAEQPRVVMVVTLRKPDPDATSTYVAAPLFREIGSEVVATWDVAPESLPLAVTP